MDAAASALRRAIRRGVSVVACSASQRLRLADVERADAVVADSKVEPVQAGVARQRREPREAVRVKRDLPGEAPDEVNVDRELFERGDEGANVLV